VLWTNEEIGLSGALAYRDTHAKDLDKHVLAMESDNGVFKPQGLLFSGAESGLPLARALGALVRRVGADSVQLGGPEADVSLLQQRGVPTISINTDATRYFWYHHSEADTADKLDPREMALCVAVMAVVANTAANMDGRLPGPVVAR
jgi:carboxypeptidase Q